MNRVNVDRVGRTPRPAADRSTISPNRGAAHGLPGVAEHPLHVDDDQPGAAGLVAGCTGLVAVRCAAALERAAARLLGPDRRAAERQRADEPDDQRDQHAEVGERPGAGLAAEAERAEQVALPGQPARVACW